MHSFTHTRKHTHKQKGKKKKRLCLISLPSVIKWWLKQKHFGLEIIMLELIDVHRRILTSLHIFWNDDTFCTCFFYCNPCIWPKASSYFPLSFSSSHIRLRYPPVPWPTPCCTLSTETTSAFSPKLGKEISLPPFTTYHLKYHSKMKKQALTIL